MDSLTSQQKIIIGVLAVVVVCVVIAGIVVVYYTLQQEPEATAVPTATDTAIPTDTSEPTATNTPELIDPVWERIKATGIIRVGMSADYPPFAYIDENFAIQGYDLALIQEIGNRMGYQLDIRNFAFDGLITALQLNDIDIAVAAISRTSDRDKFVDFSNVYFVGDDAVTARTDSTIVVNEAEDLAEYRVGVQTGSVYETWIRDELIDPGLMPPQFLITYPKPVDAINAMVQSNPSVDLVIIDFQPAEVAERSMPVKIIARGLNSQLLALAIPDGALVLQSNLNGVLNQMLNDGTLGRLAKDYLDVDSLLPLPTPAPTEIPETPTACLHNLTLVQDLTYPDFNMTQPPQFGPGETFQKGWRVRNTGTCTWDSSYMVTYRYSNPPNAPVGGAPVPVQGVVQPGQETDIFVTITTPLQAGTYQSFWTMRSPTGLFFGEVLYAGFQVVVQQTSTPQPEGPQIYSFTVRPRQISEGGCVDISWAYGGQNITGSRIFRNSALILFDIPQNGSYTDCPPGTGRMEYTLVIDSAAAGSVKSSQFIEVVPGVQPTDTPLPTDAPQPTPEPTEAPPIITYFDANPDVIDLGQNVTLSWEFSGTSLVDARLYRFDEQIGFDLPSPGSMEDSPPDAGQVRYTLVVDSEFSGSTSYDIFVTVNASVSQSDFDVAWESFISWLVLIGLS